MIFGIQNTRHIIFKVLKSQNIFRNIHKIQSKVSIGEVKKEVWEAEHPEYVPISYYLEDLPQSNLHHLKWMMQKDILGQDMFLLGSPGPRKRNIAMQYLELTNREYEYIAINRDTSESDIKQRKEIVEGVAKYFDQVAVKAALCGRVLILEGIEKAERNVLPILNNLLENREMHLEDGRFLVSSLRYDKLLKEHGKELLDKWKLERVDQNFRVIALGIPVPRYRGNPLDPPLRSRFQGRDVHISSYKELLEELKKIAPSVPIDTLESILSSAFVLLSKESLSLGIPDFPLDNLHAAIQILSENPYLSPYEIFYRLYPYKLFLKNGINNIETVLSKFDITPNQKNSNNMNLKKIVSHINTKNGISDNYVETNYQNEVLQNLLQTVAVSDLCLVGESGCGKTMLVNKVGQILSKEIENIVLYQDMTARDLLQQRATLNNGDTVWKFSPLVEAAIEGKIVVLDGINKTHPSTLSVLHRLVHNREIQLYDGKRLMSSERYLTLKKNFGLTKEQLDKSGVLKIHPDFRIIAIGDLPDLHSPSGNWLSSEVLSLFIFHEIRSLNKMEEMNIISAKHGSIPKQLHTIIELSHILRENRDSNLKSLSRHLSIRQLLRIAARLQRFATNDVYDILEEVFMINFLPSLAKSALLNTMKKIGIEAPKKSEPVPISYEIRDNILTIGQTKMEIYSPENLTKVPHILFHDVPQHIRLMERLMQDFQLGYHLLLVGNQGVGKNKIVDRFLELLNRPREYIQLHRDTTVQTLTIQPAIQDGLLIYEDSALVKAIKHGHVLVIDEADKAPTNVTSILKSLIESGHMALSDGRKIVPKGAGYTGHENYVKTHPDFRMIVLANRPGYPFLGNDFFSALGGLFSSHSVDNPSRDSEISLLKHYGPNVPENIIEKLVDIFGELRTMADQGIFSYPYSTREVVNIVKHLEVFPNSDLEDVIFNVFDYDRYNPEATDLGEILGKHGLSTKNVMSAEYIAAKRAKENVQITVNRYSGLDTKGPKHGKEDPKNEPHFGGNTWAGGTGGRDTAGLGGKGGPYRLDKGHKVHQLSDEEKNAVPEHIQRAAREMGRKAFQEKLKEIGMSGYDHSIYSQFSNAVARQVQSLRVILENLQAKTKERQWIRHQTIGELDDIKLIDGLLGEKNVFRRRAEQEPKLGSPQVKPKLFRVLVDVSGSMYRFNSYDGRLDRELEAVTLVMEAFETFGEKIKYDIFGHSGEDYNIKFVSRDNSPKNNKERLDVLRTMHAHSQFCWSGDHTLDATEWAITNLAEEDCDEAILVVLSDANLQRYGISPVKLAQTLSLKQNVNAYAIFIGSLGDQAERLLQTLPAGKAFICNDTKELPQILKQIFSSSVINS